MLLMLRRRLGVRLRSALAAAVVVRWPRCSPVRNLIDNSARHAAGTVTISVGAQGDAAEIVIGNDGPPTPADDRQRIFDRFVRLDGSRARAGGGSGLGLAIARDIVAAHGGTLTVDALDRGAAMRIRRPLPDAAMRPSAA